MGVSIMQGGGSGYPFFLQRVLYEYICGVKLRELSISKDEVPDPDVVSTVEKVRKCITCLSFKQLPGNWHQPLVIDLVKEKQLVYLS